MDVIDFDNARGAAPAADVEWVYETSSTPAGATSRGRDEISVAAHQVVVPRYVVFVQGFLLAAVALVSFVLGQLFGGSTTAPSAPGVAMPCTLTGQVTYTTSGGTRFPDEGAAILVVPTTERPSNEEKIAIESLRPGEPPPGPQHPSIQLIRQLGGSYARADIQGEFRLTVPRGGRYHVLVISHFGKRPAQRSASKADLATIGRYVTSASDLLGDHRYRLRTEDLAGETRLNFVLE